MVDFAGSRKQFAKGWKEDEPRRQSLLKDLIDIVKSHAYRQFACAIEMSTFSLLSDENKNRYNPYVLAARSCAADIRLWQVQEKFYIPTAYVFEEGDGGVGMMTDNFLGDNLPIPAFKPKKDTILPDGTTSLAYTPLQAADILAYELHKPHKDIALRHQLGVLHRSVKRPRLTAPDRLLWAWLCGAWSDWRSALIMVQPETVIGWHRKGFRLFWRWKKRTGFTCRSPCAYARPRQSQARSCGEDFPVPYNASTPRKMLGSRHY